MLEPVNDFKSHILPIQKIKNIHKKKKEVFRWIKLGGDFGANVGICYLVQPLRNDISMREKPIWWQSTPSIDSGGDIAIFENSAFCT